MNKEKNKSAAPFYVQVSLIKVDQQGPYVNTGKAFPPSQDKMKNSN